MTPILDLIGCLIEVALKLLDFDAGTHAAELGAPQKRRLHCRLRFAAPFRMAQVSTVAGSLGRQALRLHFVLILTFDHISYIQRVLENEYGVPQSRKAIQP